MKLFLDKGANIEVRGRAGQTPLLYAAHMRNYGAAMTLLLDREADIKAKTVLGQTPLWLGPAAAGGWFDGTVGRPSSEATAR